MIDFKEADLLSVLPSNLLEAETQALSEAIRIGLRQLQRYSRAAPLYAAVEDLPDDVLDLLAVELRVQYYSPGGKRSVRENMIKRAVAWYLRGGTGSILTEYLGTLYRGGKLDEWYTYGGKPYFFKATVSLGLDDAVGLGDGAKIADQINAYKNVRSWLEDLSFNIRAAVEVPVRCENAVRFSTAFYPRFNLGFLHLDDTWTLDNTCELSGYDGSDYLDFYPVQVRISAGGAHSCDTTSSLRIQSGVPAEVKTGERLRLLQEARAPAVTEGRIRVLSTVQVTAETTERLRVGTGAAEQVRISGRLCVTGAAAVQDETGAQIRVQGSAALHLGTASFMTREEYLDGSNLLDGSRLLNGGRYIL